MREEQLLRVLEFLDMKVDKATMSLIEIKQNLRASPATKTREEEQAYLLEALEMAKSYGHVEAYSDLISFIKSLSPPSALTRS